MDLSKALDKVMRLPTKEAKAYAQKYVDQLREVDSCVASTTPDETRAVVLEQVRDIAPESKDELEDRGMSIVDINDSADDSDESSECNDGTDE